MRLDLAAHLAELFELQFVRGINLVFFSNIVLRFTHRTN